MDEAMKLVTKMLDAGTPSSSSTDPSVSTEGEMDDIRRLFTDTNPILVLVTFIVSIFHLLIDFLAFKNDISFWRQRKSFVGLSFSSLLLSLFVSSVILLYLIDQQASKLVLINSVVSIVIIIWKIVRVMRWTCTFKRCCYRRSEEEDEQENNGGRKQKRRQRLQEQQTQKYDQQAMKFLSYFLIPVVIAFAVYSLLYHTHTSWYASTNTNIQQQQPRPGRTSRKSMIVVHD
jgi:small-conductance mechanosensitive channel